MAPGKKVIRVANTELLTTYYEIGRTILEQKEKAGWGKKVIEKLANDLRAKFPNMKGLSQRNLEYMQTFDWEKGLPMLATSLM